MVRRRKHFGHCHLCGCFGKLSFEHVPPESAFNDKRVLVSTDSLEDIIKAGAGLGPLQHSKPQQRGAGGHTLCEDCNNKTGAWYVNDFADWCHQGANILSKTRGTPSLLYANNIYPLRILKQICTMFFSTNGEAFQAAHPYLVDFCLSPQKKFLPPEYGVYCYFNWQGKPRYTGIAGQVSFSNGGFSMKSKMSEITFPPYGYVMTLDSPPPDKRLFDITPFAQYGYDEWAQLFLKLPVLPTHIAYMPGDYRTLEEIEETRRQNLLEYPVG